MVGSVVGSWMLVEELVLEGTVNAKETETEWVPVLCQSGWGNDGQAFGVGEG